MKRIRSIARDFMEKGDPVLLILCLLTSGFGLLLVYSATRWTGRNNNILVQFVAILLGVFAYLLLSLLDLQLFVDKCWRWIFLFNVGFILLELSPLGYTSGGNTNWLQIHPKLPLLQPDEIVKLPFILLMARQISRIREKEQDISSIPSVLQLTVHTLFMVGLITVICGDMGMCVIYVCIFAGMAWAAGVKLRWFIAAGGTAAAAVLYLWNFILPESKYWTDYRIMRFRVVLDHNLDPLDRGFQQTRSLLAIGSGGLTGMGYLHGTQTQAAYSDALPARHTDFIFSVCGEEFGLIGCAVLLLLLTLIVLRCVYVACRCDSLFYASLCVGVAAMLLAQTSFNVGMCLFVAPVMGLTLPFISYGGSSVVTMFAAMGLVSSAKAQRKPSWLKDYK